MSRRRVLRYYVPFLIGVALCFVSYFGTPYFRDGAIRTLEWVDGLGHWAPVAFVVVSALGVVLVIPGFIFSWGAGFMFGFFEGLVLLWLSINIGAVAAFLVGRYSGSNRLLKALEKRDQWRKVNDSFRQKGWRVVMLTRVIPMFPYKLSNYAFGMAGYSLKDFWIGTTIGIIPLCAFNVYMGSLAGALSDIGIEGRRFTPVEWAAYIVGFLILAAGVTYLTVKVRKALQQMD